MNERSHNSTTAGAAGKGMSDAGTKDSPTDPNPTRGHESAWWLGFFAISLLVKLPFLLVWTILQRLLKDVDMSFHEDLQRAMVRNVMMPLPLPAFRKLMSLGKSPDILWNSDRFGKYKTDILHEVIRSDFAGWWICRGPPGKLLAPADCDVVILFAHGGGYVLGHPLADAGQQLRMAEIAYSKGVTMSIFSLNYSLAPEHRFPIQQKQAIAAYRYLIQEQKINPAKIIVFGTSAGAHLMLHLLYSLSHENLARPGGALLSCPWVDLNTKVGESLHTNKYKCINTVSYLNRSQSLLLTGVDRNEYVDIIDFTRLRSRSKTWREILPSFTWVMVGSHDTFLDMDRIFVKNAQADGAAVQLEVIPGEPHAWHMASDRIPMVKYLKLLPGQNIDFALPGASSLADALLAILERMGRKL